MKRVLCLCVCLCLASISLGAGSGLDKLCADLKQAWKDHANSYHRFLAAAYHLALDAMDKQDWDVVDAALRRQGVKYEAQIDVQHVTTSDPIFRVKIGGLEHDVRLCWLIVAQTSSDRATRHVVIEPEVRLTLSKKMSFDEYRRKGAYPPGTIMLRVLSDPQLAKHADKFPVVGDVVIWYERSGPYISQEVEPNEGFPCEFGAYVDLEKPPGVPAAGVRDWFYATSGLDRPLTMSGK